VITELCEVHDLPAENLLTPDLVRAGLGAARAAGAGAGCRRAAAGGARRWQIELTAARLTAALDAALDAED
jgi:ribonuclease D